ncbi:hypothetical protein PENTCL1PPCAC_24473, partial [Pristionchus entomophagus]
YSRSRKELTRRVRKPSPRLSPRACVVTFPSSLCSATSIIYEDASRTIRIERELTEQYECEPAGFWQGLP